MIQSYWKSSEKRRSCSYNIGAEDQIGQTSLILHNVLVTNDGEFAWVRKQARIFEILNIYLTALCDTIGQLLTFLCIGIRVYGIPLCYEYGASCFYVTVVGVYTLHFPFIDLMMAQ